MVSLIENASVTERSAIKGLAHFRVSHRRHHLADDGSAPRLVVSAKSVRGVPTGGPTTGVPTATQSRGLSPARGHWRSYTPVPIDSLNRRGLYLSVF